jgi:hypothetical protein
VVLRGQRTAPHLGAARNRHQQPHPAADGRQRDCRLAREGTPLATLENREAFSIHAQISEFIDSAEYFAAGTVKYWFSSLRFP